MYIPLLKVEQKKEFLFTTKMSVRKLREYVVLSFRYPYIESLNENQKESDKLSDYLNKLKKKNLNIEFGANSVQRKLQLNRLTLISNFIKETNNILPNAVILGCFNEKAETNSNFSYEEAIVPVDDTLGLYKIELNSDYKMTVIDGQHRLAGLFVSDDDEILDMELPIVLLFGVSLSTAAKIFIDINGNQKTVDPSLIYDLTTVLENENEEVKLKDKEIESIKKCHKIIKTFYDTPGSPLYRQIRMLGTGKGAVSQAFLVDILYPLVHNGILSSYNIQDMFDSIFYYLAAFQSVFQDDWPVLADTKLDELLLNLPKDIKVEDFKNQKQDEHANVVLNEKKSQLAKTLGLGALLSTKVFPYVFSKCQFDEDCYIEFAKQLKNKIAWNREEFEKSEEKLFYPTGTNKSSINQFANYIKENYIQSM